MGLDEDGDVLPHFNFWSQKHRAILFDLHVFALFQKIKSCNTLEMLLTPSFAQQGGVFEVLQNHKISRSHTRDLKLFHSFLWSRLVRSSVLSHDSMLALKFSVHFLSLQKLDSEMDLFFFN